MKTKCCDVSYRSRGRASKDVQSSQVWAGVRVCGCAARRRRFSSGARTTPFSRRGDLSADPSQPTLSLLPQLPPFFVSP
jgi:hypothetical protein